MSDPLPPPVPDRSPLAPEASGLEADADGATPEAPTPEREELESSPSTRCLNCGDELPGTFCPTCGQKDQPLRTPIQRYVIEALAEYLGLDGRVWPTLRALLFRPGRLTQAYVLGRRQQYIRPLRIYITASLLFFFLLALFDPIGKIRNAVDDGDAVVDSAMTVEDFRAIVQARIDDDEADAERLRAEADSARALADSLLQAFAADSLAGAFAEADSLGIAQEAVREALADAEDAQEEAASGTASIRDRRALWLAEQLGRLRPDSTIEPEDYEKASELVIRDGDSGPTINGPDWMLRGESIQRLRTSRTSDERRDAGWRLANDVVDKVPTVIFLLLPFFALLLKLLFVRRGWFYAEHLVFALHVHAFAFVVFSVYALLVWASGGAGWAGAAGTLLTLTIPVYFLVAMRRVYAQGWVKTMFKSYLLAWMYGFVLIGGALLALALAAAAG